MKTIKSILNNKIAKMVTRERVLKVSGCDADMFTDNIVHRINNGYTDEDYEMVLPDGGEEPIIDGVDIFIKEFCEEGWCKTELSSIIDTLLHLNRSIDDYGCYWF